MFELHTPYRFTGIVERLGSNTKGGEFILLKGVKFIKNGEEFRDHVWCSTNHKPKLDITKK